MIWLEASGKPSTFVSAGRARRTCWTTSRTTKSNFQANLNEHHVVPHSELLPLLKLGLSFLSTVRSALTVTITHSLAGILWPIHKIYTPASPTTIHKYYMYLNSYAKQNKTWNLVHIKANNRYWCLIYIEQHNERKTKHKSGDHTWCPRIRCVQTSRSKRLYPANVYVCIHTHIYIYINMK